MIQEIATEKAGIFKRGSPAITIPQPEEAQQALEVNVVSYKFLLLITFSFGSVRQLSPCKKRLFLQLKASEAGVELSVAAALDSYRTMDGQEPSVGLAGR